MPATFDLWWLLIIVALTLSVPATFAAARLVRRRIRQPAKQEPASHIRLQDAAILSVFFGTKRYARCDLAMLDPFITQLLESERMRVNEGAQYLRNYRNGFPTGEFPPALDPGTPEHHKVAEMIGRACEAA